jgi:hemolysin activation/secretion protein
VGCNLILHHYYGWSRKKNLITLGSLSILQGAITGVKATEVTDTAQPLPLNTPSLGQDSRQEPIAQLPNLRPQIRVGPRPFVEPLPAPDNLFQGPKPLQQVPPGQQQITPPIPAPSKDLLTVPEFQLPPSGISPEDQATTIIVKQFRVNGNTVFSSTEINKTLAPYTNRPLTLEQLLEARSAITQLYINAGYITSGAYIPPQEPKDGTITIQVIEGQLQKIQLKGNRRLRPSYIESRLKLAGTKPLNINRLLDRLRLLKLDPLIADISAELAAGIEPGTSILNVEVEEAKTFGVDLGINNDRVSIVGSVEKWIQLSQANLLGYGDGLTIDYTNTTGSNEVNLKYVLPVNPRNGTLTFRYGYYADTIIQPPFDQLDITGKVQYYDVTYRQPIIQTPTQELALGLTLARENTTNLYLGNILGESIPFPKFGSDINGNSQVSALRFTQEWSKRGRRDVFAARSQFSLGLEPSDVPLYDIAPNGHFFSWLGQAQWVRELAPDTLFLLRGELQLANSTLNPLEQFGLGGRYTVRGYPQYILLTDNGWLANAEVRFPLYRNERHNRFLQGIVFLDAGSGWNVELANPSPNTLVGTGLGLQYQFNARTNASIYWGIPLVKLDYSKNNLQESGIYFSLQYNLF